MNDGKRSEKPAPHTHLKIEQRSSWARCKVIIDSLSGIAVIGTLIFIALQWHEMRVGSIDTHNLAVAAHDQAQTAHDQAKTSAGQLAQMEKALKRQDKLIEQVKSQAKSANSLASSSKRSANAAWEAVKEARQEDRPWLGFTKFIPSTPVAGAKLHVDADLQNSGKSPAQMLSTVMWIGPHIGEIYAFSQIELPVLASRATPSRAVLVPGEQYAPYSADQMLNFGDLQRANESIVNLYAIGLSTYRGIDEPRSTEHHTSMCEVWLVKEKKWALCGFLNNAD